MSVVISSAVWEKAPVGGAELLLLVALADWADDDGYSWHSIASLAKKTRISERSIRRHLRKLEECGWLAISARKDLAGRSTSNLYRVVCGEGVNLTGGAVTCDRGEAVTCDPLILLNRKIESSITPPTPSRDEEHPPPPEDTPTPSGTNLNGTHAQSPDETQRSQLGTTRDFTPYSKEQQAGPGSEQKQRLAAKKRGERFPKTPPPPAPAISQPGTEGMTKRQLRKARTKGEAEKWLARHTSTSSS